MSAKTSIKPSAGQASQLPTTIGRIVQLKHAKAQCSGPHRRCARGQNYYASEVRFRALTPKGARKFAEAELGRLLGSSSKRS